MTKKSLIKKLEATLKAYNKLWDRLEMLESELDDAENEITTEITGWTCSEMRDGLAFNIEALQSAIKDLKKRK